MPEDQRLLNLIKWKLEKSRLAREERNRRLEQEMGVSLRPPEEVRKDNIKIKFPPSEN